MNRNWRHHLVLITILSLLVCRTATAHDALASWTIARVTPEALNVEVNIAADSAWSAVQRTVSPGTEFIAEQFESVGRPRLIAFARTLQVVTVDGNRVEPSAVDATMDFDDFDLRLTYPLPPGAQRLEIREPYLTDQSLA